MTFGGCGGWFRFVRAKAAAIAAVGLCAAACGGKADETEGGDGGAGNPDDRRVTALSNSELKALCDWSAKTLGGYGARKVCPSGVIDITPPENQAACLANAPSGTCKTTVAQYKACMTAVGKDVCKAAATFATPACAPVIACAKLPP